MPLVHLEKEAEEAPARFPAGAPRRPPRRLAVRQAVPELHLRDQLSEVCHSRCLLPAMGAHRISGRQRATVESSQVVRRSRKQEFPRCIDRASNEASDQPERNTNRASDQLERNIDRGLNRRSSDQLERRPERAYNRVSDQLEWSTDSSSDQQERSTDRASNRGTGRLARTWPPQASSGRTSPAGRRSTAGPHAGYAPRAPAGRPAAGRPPQRLPACTPRTAGSHVSGGALRPTSKSRAQCFAK